MKSPPFILHIICIYTVISTSWGQQTKSRDLGIQTGFMNPGIYNAITDVAGVRVQGAASDADDVAVA